MIGREKQNQSQNVIKIKRNFEECNYENNCEEAYTAGCFNERSAENPKGNHKMLQKLIVNQFSWEDYVHFAFFTKIYPFVNPE